MKHSTPSNPKTFRIHQPIKANPLKQTQLPEHPPNKSTFPLTIRGITQANHQTKPTKSQQTHPLPRHRNPSNHKKTIPTDCCDPSEHKNQIPINNHDPLEHNNTTDRESLSSKPPPQCQWQFFVSSSERQSSKLSAMEV